MDALAGPAAPAPLADLPAAHVAKRGSFGGWQRIADAPPEGLDRWSAAHLPQLCALAERGLAALAGDCLTHADLRADNLLVRPDGTVLLIDWPHASRAAPWFDRLLLVNVRLFAAGPADHARLPTRPGRRHAGPAARITARLSGSDRREPGPALS